ncbi:BTB/POZ-like domain containing protein [Pseudohyphozyma bogoriensis]|nr:BTB/POZ-like domain containing protein [Pseudohyphozyma bogoriensis]
MSSDWKVSRSTTAHNHSSLSQYSNNVQFLFPKSGKELWANSTILKNASPYFKTFFDSGFKEAVGTTREERDVATKEVLTPSVALQSTDEDISDHSEFEDSDREMSPPADAADEGSKKVFPITITEHEFKTYHATLIYILTGNITFAPLSSNKSSVVSLTASDAGPPSASPKSIYRLADLLEITKLKSKAVDSFEGQLTVDNVIHELFSEVSRTYTDIQNVALDFAATNWVEVRETTAMKALEENEASSSLVLARLAVRLGASTATTCGSCGRAQVQCYSCRNKF